MESDQDGYVAGISIPLPLFNQNRAVIQKQQIALKIANSKQIVIASIDTDGTDGPTKIAGGIVDGWTLHRANQFGINIFEQLKRHNTSYVLESLEDSIITGPTGTNVMNLRVIVITMAS